MRGIGSLRHGRAARKDLIDAPAQCRIRLRTGGRLCRQQAVCLRFCVITLAGGERRILAAGNGERHCNILRRGALTGKDDASLRHFRRANARCEIGRRISVRRHGVHSILRGHFCESKRLSPAGPAARRKGTGVKGCRIQHDVCPAETDPFPVIRPQFEQGIALPQQQVQCIRLRRLRQCIDEKHLSIQNRGELLRKCLRAVRRILGAVNFRAQRTEIFFRNGVEVDRLRPMFAVQRAAFRIRRLCIVGMQGAHKGAVLADRIKGDFVGSVSKRRIPRIDGARGKKTVAQVRPDRGERLGDRPIHVFAGRRGELRPDAALDGELRRKYR